MDVLRNEKTPNDLTCYRSDQFYGAWHDDSVLLTEFEVKT